LRNRSILLVLGIALITLVPALPALACSCAYGDPRERLAEADGAFIGTLVSQTETDPPEPGEPVSSDRDNTYTFTVEEVFKGDIGDTVEVHAPADGASCGLEMHPGDTDGLFLYLDEEGLWNSSLCSRVPPNELREAAAPLPEPDGEGPIRFLVGGSYGEVRTVALDDQGRTLAYGYGHRDTTDIDVCPGSRYSVEAVDTRRRSALFTVRDLSSFEVVEQFEIEGWNNWYGGSKPDPQALYCRDEDAQEIFAFGSTRREPTSLGELIRIDPAGIHVVARGSYMFGNFTDDTLFVAGGKWGRNLAAIDLDTGAKKAVARAHRYAVPYPSPDGNWVATYYADWSGEAPSTVSLFPTNDDEQMTKQLSTRPTAGQIVWRNNSSPVFLPFGGDTNTAKVFDLNLKVDGSFDWYARSPSVVDGAVYGLSYEEITRADLPAGPAESFHELLLPIAYVLEPVP
jgi:hypothetical protein